MSGRICEASEYGGQKDGEKALPETRKNESEGCEDVPGTKRRKITVENSLVLEPISQGNEEKNRAASLAPKTPEIFLLNTYCWERVLSYLSVGDQLSLAASSPHLKSLFETLSLKYKRITESVTAKISENELSQLLEIVNENVISYESELGSFSNGDRNLWLLRTFCPRLQHLKMTFSRSWNDLLQFKCLTSLHVYLKFSSAKTSRNFVLSLVKLPCLRKLNLQAENYSGDGLHVLENLESLAISAYPGINAECLATACLKMKKLRHLGIGKFFEKLTEDNVRVIVKNCGNLESLSFGREMIKENVPYEIVCQLPKLKHLRVSVSGFLRAGFIEGLIHKTGTPLESLILWGVDLNVEQVEHLCEISSLRELSIQCDSVPLSGLLKLRNLEILELRTSEITNHQLLTMLEGCPLIRVLGLEDGLSITSDFVRDATRLFGCRKIKIYLQGPLASWNYIKGNRVIQFEHGSLGKPFLFNY